MKILNVAYPLLPVGPGSAGGAEQILYLLERGLAQRQVQTFSVAAEQSQISGELLATPAASANVTDEERSNAQKIHRQTIQQLIAREHLDAIHFHGLDFGSYLPDADILMIATIHLPVPWYEAGSLDRPNVHLVAVSETQA
ncbi:MAG: glycosyltransferase family 4 protein, partial [Bryobacteraceae bacterium]